MILLWQQDDYCFLYVYLVETVWNNNSVCKAANYTAVFKLHVLSWHMRTFSDIWESKSLGKIWRTTYVKGNSTWCSLIHINFWELSLGELLWDPVLVLESDSSCSGLRKRQGEMTASEPGSFVLQCRHSPWQDKQCHRWQPCQQLSRFSLPPICIFDQKWLLSVGDAQSVELGDLVIWIS